MTVLKRRLPRLGDVVRGRKRRDGARYTFVLNRDHVLVLNVLEAGGSVSDEELGAITNRHMLSPRRCELRDAGFVAAVPGGKLVRGRRQQSWSLTVRGRRLLESL